MNNNVFKATETITTNNNNENNNPITNQNLNTKFNLRNVTLKEEKYPKLILKNTESQTNYVKISEPKLRKDFNAQYGPNYKSISLQAVPITKSVYQQTCKKTKSISLQISPKIKSTSSQISPETISVSTQKSNKIANDNMKLRKELLKVKSQLSRVEKQNKILKSKKHVDSILKERLSVKFTNAQAHLIINNNVKGRWQNEDITNGLILKSFSRTSYEFLRNKLKLPFPSLTTLHEWTKNFDTSPGIQYDILNVIKDKVNLNSDIRKRFVIISFDEMTLRNEISYCQRYEKIYKGAKQIQVVMVRGLKQNWKQPVFFDFDTAVTKDLLFNIIKELHKINLIVCGISSDMGSTNKSLWNELGISVDKTYFENPEMKSGRVYVFSDPCHILKNIRNHLLDNGYKFKDGSKITDKPLISLIAEKDTGEFRCTHKLQMIHLNCKSSERQRVCYATQLLSNSTSEALKNIFPNDKEAQDLSEFIKVVDSWFDVMNSSLIKDKKYLKCAFGLHLNEQKKALLKAIDVFTYLNQIKCPRKTDKLKPYQYGLIVSSKSLLGLYDYLSTNYNFKYIITSRLNSDVVENFFSRLRDMCGTHRTPNCAEVIIRFRIMAISRNAEFAVKTAAVKCEDSTNENSNFEDFEENTFNKILNTVEDIEKNISDESNNEIDEELIKDINLMLNDVEGFDNTIKNESSVEEDFEFDIGESKCFNKNENEFKDSCINISPRLNKTKTQENTKKSNYDKEAQENEFNIEEEGFIYVGGFIAHKILMKYPDVGTQTRDINPQTSKQKVSTWIGAKSTGGLIQPTDKFINELKQMEDKFLDFHNRHKNPPLDTERYVMKRLTKEISDYMSNYPTEIIKKFVVTRTFIRIKYLNKVKNIKEIANRARKLTKLGHFYQSNTK